MYLSERKSTDCKRERERERERGGTFIRILRLLIYSCVRKFRPRNDESISPPTDPLNDFAVVESIRWDVSDGSAGTLYRPGRNRAIIARQRILSKIGLVRLRLLGPRISQRSLLYFSRNEDKADLSSDESWNILQTKRRFSTSTIYWIAILLHVLLLLMWIFLSLIFKLDF